MLRSATMVKITLTVGCLSGALSAVAQPAVDDDTPSLQAIWTLVRQQQAEIDALKLKIAAQESQLTTTNERQTDTAASLAATNDYIANLASESERHETTLAGYGEIHYNSVQAENPANDFDEIDFHRFVLFVGRRLSERASFYSELELEHSLAGDGAPGEIELEQAFVDFRIGDRLSARGGLFLLPVGILNQTHEPTTFFGVERNDVESIIIPSTWWEAGGGLSGGLGEAWSWDVGVHSGLAIPVTGTDAFRVRSGRQKVAEALGSDLAYTGRIRYSGMPGVEWSASFQHQSDPSQIPGDGLDSGQLFTTDLTFLRNNIGLRALFGSWQFDGPAVEAADADRQSGWYVEPSYRLNDRWGVYARFEELDAARDIDQFDQWEIGANYWPNPRVVIKLDYRQREHELSGLSGRDFDALDLGLGYQF